MKYLAIDYGKKKIGIATSDDGGEMAFPCMVIENNKMLLTEVKQLCKELKIGAIVMGESLDQNGKPNAIAKDARKFGATIENAIDVIVKFEKEWYSTVEARKQPGKGGDHEVDDQAAAIVLQRHLDKINGPGTATEEYTGEEDDEETTEESW